MRAEVDVALLPQRAQIFLASSANGCDALVAQLVGVVLQPRQRLGGDLQRGRGFAAAFGLLEPAGQIHASGPHASSRALIKPAGLVAQRDVGGAQRRAGVASTWSASATSPSIG